MEDVRRNGKKWKTLGEIEECGICWKKWRSVEDVGRNGKVWRMLEEMEKCGGCSEK